MGKWESEELQEDLSGIKDTGNSVGLGVDTKAISSLFFRSILLDFAESFRDCWARLTKRGGWFTGAHFCTGSVWTRQYCRLYIEERDTGYLSMITVVLACELHSVSSFGHKVHLVST